MFHENKAYHYRQDIDGLRALAIVSVVLFHVFPGFLRGGFVGVDIFFVISGYLIGGIIHREMMADSFSFVYFYSRRVRRIFPALILVLLLTTLAGSLLLTIKEQIQLGKHVLGAASFVANIVYWNEAGYFDISVETKPLLHIWSLGIEEQFYLAFPLLLFAAWRRVSLTKLVVVLLLSSFAYSIYSINTDIVTAFYSPLARFWELMAGCLLALNAVSFRRVIFDNRNSISIAGFLMLIFAILFIDKSASFPGYYALVPVVGTVLIILSGEAAIVNRVIASRPMVAIGLISYPLYLWHWPILAFYKIAFGQGPSYIAGLSLLVISVILSYLTWRLVELPVQRCGYRSIKVLSVLMVLVAIIGSIFYIQDFERTNESAAEQGMELLNPK